MSIASKLKFSFSIYSQEKTVLRQKKILHMYSKKHNSFQSKIMYNSYKDIFLIYKGFSLVERKLLN